MTRRSVRHLNSNKGYVQAWLRPHVLHLVNTEHPPSTMKRFNTQEAKGKRSHQGVFFPRMTHNSALYTSQYTSLRYPYSFLQCAWLCLIFGPLVLHLLDAKIVLFGLTNVFSFSPWAYCHLEIGLWIWSFVRSVTFYRIKNVNGMLFMIWIYV